MATNKLTDTQIRREKPSDKPRKLSDGNGMYLFISPTGAKVWRMAYKGLNGKEQVAVLGPYPLLGLADARAKRDDFRRKLLDGIDLRAKPKHSITFKQASDAYWTGRKDVTEKYRGNATRGLSMHLKRLDDLPIATITRQLLLDPLLTLDNQGKHDYTRKVRVWASMVFEWAKSNEHCKENPADLINPKTTFGRRKVIHHPALKITELPAFFERLPAHRDKPWLQHAESARVFHGIPSGLPDALRQADPAR